MNDTRLIRLPTVMNKVGIKRTAIYSMIKRNKFPKPAKVGSASVWVEGEIDQWIRDVGDNRSAVQ